MAVDPADEGGLEIPDDPPGIGSAPLAVSLLPFALLLALYFVFPAYGSLAFSGRASIVGIPIGMVALGVGLLWAALGVYLASEAETFAEATAAFVTCSLPAAAIVALAPLLQKTML